MSHALSTVHDRPAFVSRIHHTTHHPTSLLRLLIVPGLHNSGPAHWQTWLEQRHPGSVRVTQRDWHTPDLDAWAERIEHTVQAAGPARWLVAAHSFGVLALARWQSLQTNPSAHRAAVLAAWLAAPADPDKFGVTARLPHQPWACPTTLIGSDDDPWMQAGRARAWAHRWGSRFINAGRAGHINTESGYGPWSAAHEWVTAQLRRAAWPSAHPPRLAA